MDVRPDPAKALFPTVAAAGAEKDVSEAQPSKALGEMYSLMPSTTLLREEHP